MYSMLDTYTLHFDGSCGPDNPGGTAAYGYTLSRHADLLEEKGAIVGFGPEMSNNVAEYAGLYEGLVAFSEQWKENNAFLMVRGDSRLVINQMSGKWKARGGLYYPYYQMAAGIASHLRKRGARINFEWIPREFNTQCDDLSKAHHDNV